MIIHEIWQEDQVILAKQIDELADTSTNILSSSISTSKVFP